MKGAAHIPASSPQSQSIKTQQRPSVWSIIAVDLKQRIAALRKTERSVLDRLNGNDQHAATLAVRSEASALLLALSARLQAAAGGVVDELHEMPEGLPEELLDQAAAASAYLELYRREGVL